MKLIFLFSFLNKYHDAAVSTVQPLGIPLVPVTFHVAEAFLTKVPEAATPYTQLLVYDEPGVVVNIALM